MAVIQSTNQLVPTLRSLMPGEKQILDIRIYEVPCEGCEPASGYIGYVFHQPKSVAHNTQRIARKLREVGFTLGGRTDHLYIELHADTALGTVVVAHRAHADAVCRVQYGLDRNRFNALSDNERVDVLTRAVFAVLRHLTDSKDAGNRIDAVEQALAEQQTQLEITHKTKTTKTYTVGVSFRIRPADGRSVAFVTHTDHKSGTTLRSHPIELDHHSDIYLLCGNIAVRDRTVILKPSASIEGRVVSERYGTPIEIPLHTMSAPPADREAPVVAESALHTKRGRAAEYATRTSAFLPRDATSMKDGTRFEGHCGACDSKRELRLTRFGEYVFGICSSCYFSDAW